MAKRVLILATCGFEQSELIEPRALLEVAGYETVLASPRTSEIRSWHEGDWGPSVPVDADLDTIDADDFDALLLPGGLLGADTLRQDDRAVALVEHFDDTGKPIAALGHGAWLLVEADMIDGRTITCWPAIRTDLENAGADVLDEAVVLDDNLVTARHPDDIPTFVQALIDALEAGDDDDFGDEEDEEEL